MSEHSEFHKLLITEENETKTRINRLKNKISDKDSIYKTKPSYFIDEHN